MITQPLIYPDHQLQQKEKTESNTVCPRILNPFYAVGYYMIWIRTSLIYSICKLDEKPGIFVRYQILCLTWPNSRYPDGIKPDIRYPDGI